MRLRKAIGRLADEELMQLVAAGDAQAFEAIYDRHGGAAYSLAYRILGNRTLAEEATQEALLTTWRSRLRYDPERGSVRSWLLSIVHSRTVDAVRRNAVHERRRASAEGIEERFEAGHQTDVEAVKREEARTLRTALDALPERQGEVIELAYFGGFSVSQIAQLLEVPLGTVKGRMRLGLEKLRGHLLSEQGSLL